MRKFNLVGVRLVSVWLFLLTFSLLSVSCGEENPLETVTTESLDVASPVVETQNALRFINAYVENCNKSKDATSAVVWVNSIVWVTQDFKNQLTTMVQQANEKDPEMGLGFDPILNAQDYPTAGFEIDSTDSVNQYIVLKGKDWDSFKLTLRLRYFNSQWLVDGCGVVNMPADKQDKR